MKITGIIAEYNPFHNGHRYQIDMVRKSGADFIIAVMSGDFVQRGEPAIVDKYRRTRMALQNGIDLVLELPVTYATAGANHFAQGGVSLLHMLGVVDELAFGVEEGYDSSVVRLADFLSSPPEAYDAELDKLLRDGITFPRARQQALSLFLAEEDLKCLELPNSILALEYCKIIKKLNSHITPLPIARMGSGYNDTVITDGIYGSASAIRSELYSGNISSLRSQVPDNVYEILGSSGHLSTDCLDSQLHYALMLNRDYTQYEEVTDGLANRIRENISGYEGFNAYADLLKTKNITHAGIRRSLLHILLELKTDIPPVAPYARILGFRKQSDELLGLIKKNSMIPLISKVADAAPNELLGADIKSADIYNAAYYDSFGEHIKNDYSHEIVII